MAADPGAGLVLALAAFALLAGSPGPATMAVAGTAMARGRRAGLALALGLTLGLGAWSGLAALGIGGLVLRFGPSLVALKLIGGVSAPSRTQIRT